jgi:hypothetical protein
MPEKPSKLIPALYGGVIMGVISGIPFLNFVNCLCCAGVMLGGFMAVFFYTKDLGPADPPLTNGDAVQLGALSGVFGALVGVVLTVVLHFTLGGVENQAMSQMILGLYEKMGILDKMPPEAIEKMKDQITDTAFSALSVIPPFIIDPIFGLIGGVIGFNVFKPKGPAVSQPPMAN